MRESGAVRPPRCFKLPFGRGTIRRSRERFFFSAITSPQSPNKKKSPCMRKRLPIPNCQGHRRLAKFTLDLKARLHEIAQQGRSHLNSVAVVELAPVEFHLRH